MKKQSGFTLIEIVMVLVLLGILSAVAVPKYFDLQDEAQKKAAVAIAAEYQAQFNGAFAQALLQNKSCAKAREDAVAVANGIKISNGSIKSVKLPDNIDTATGAIVGHEITINGTKYTAELNNNNTPKADSPFIFAIPACSSNDKREDEKEQ